MLFMEFSESLPTRVPRGSAGEYGCGEGPYCWCPPPHFAEGILLLSRLTMVHRGGGGRNPWGPIRGTIWNVGFGVKEVTKTVSDSYDVIKQLFVSLGVVSVSFLTVTLWTDFNSMLLVNGKVVIILMLDYESGI